MKKGDWVICPLTKDDIDKPTIVAEVYSVEDDIVNVNGTNGTIPIPKSWCRVVQVQIPTWKLNQITDDSDDYWSKEQTWRKD